MLMRRVNEMRQIKKNKCSVLNLVLKRKWYDMIASGDKKEEYRESKMYWWTRIGRWMANSIPDGDAFDILFGEKKPKVVAFSLGYNKADMFFVVDTVLDPDAKYPERTCHPEWGEPGFPHYVIKLGERVELVE
jgi:hypothetical protein